MSYVTWLPRIVIHTLWYIKELVVSNLTVIGDNLTPGQNSRPGIVRLKTHCRTDAEVTLLATLITLTPGTLALSQVTAGDTRDLYVHGMYADGPDDLRVQLWHMERHMLSAMRREGAPS
jgi:multicomponent Na+:H+ antiporter subunit E